MISEIGNFKTMFSKFDANRKAPLQLWGCLPKWL